MKKAIKYTENVGFIYIYLKKHCCPECGGRVQVRYISKLVNAKSPEAKQYDFSSLTGEIDLRTVYFYCPKCKQNISFEDMKNFEGVKNKK